jgi:autotransporter-associated beta strand protein
VPDFRGTLTSAGTNAFTLANNLSFSGTLGLGDAVNTGALTLSGNATLGSNLTINTYSPGTLSGAISGSYSLTKAGNSELTLSGANAFTGTTTITAGTLTISGNNALVDTMLVTGSIPGTLNVNASESIGMLNNLVSKRMYPLTLSGLEAGMRELVR